MPHRLHGNPVSPELLTEIEDLLADPLREVIVSGEADTKPAADD